MKKIVFSVLALSSAGMGSLYAQSIEDGTKALYYQKFTSAEQIFQQLIQKDPKNDQAIYWLGQVYLENTTGEANGIQKAAQLYQQAATSGINSPWILVGLGEIDYQNKNVDAAEKKFEQAQSNDYFKGRNKDINKAAIQTAIGRASAYNDKEFGDPTYAIPVLQNAANLNKTDPWCHLYLGRNFLKMGGDMGGNAYAAYNDAVTLDPKFAAGYYYMGLIFKAQDQFDIMDEWFQKGIAADANYAPIYWAYFDYWKNKDVNKAKPYLDKFVSLSDNGCYVQYYQAEYLFQAMSYQQSLDKAKQMETGACASYSHLPLLQAMDYHRLGDNANAVTYAKKFFATTSPINVSADDYAYGGFIYKEDSTMVDSAIAYLQRAYQMDTLPAERAIYSDSISYAFSKADKPLDKYNWDRYIYSKSDTTTDGYNIKIFNVGQDALVLGATDHKYYATADSFFTLYKTRYPNQIYGYQKLAASKLAQGDTIAAEPFVLDYVNQLKKDSVTNKDEIVAQYGTLAGYYVNSKGDYATGLKYLDAILGVDPANDNVKQMADQIRAYLNKKNAPATSGAKAKTTK